VLYAAEALLFGGGDKLAVADERGSRIGMESINPQNNHTRRIGLKSGPSGITQSRTIRRVILMQSVPSLAYLDPRDRTNIECEANETWAATKVMCGLPWACYCGLLRNSDEAGSPPSNGLVFSLTGIGWAIESAECR
jgi:hypothetical protein